MKVDPPSGTAEHVKVVEQNDMNVAVNVHCDHPVCGDSSVDGCNAAVHVHYNPPMCGDSTKGGEHVAVDVFCDPPMCGTPSTMHVMKQSMCAAILRCVGFFRVWQSS